MNLLLSVTRPWPSPITRLDSGIHGQSVFYLVLAMSSLLSSSVPPFTFRCLNSAKTSKLTLEASSSASVTVLSQIDSTADLFSKALGMVPSLQCRSSVTKHFRSVPTRSDSNHLLGYLVLQLPTGQSSVTIFKDLIMIEAEPSWRLCSSRALAARSTKKNLLPPPNPLGIKKERDRLRTREGEKWRSLKGENP